MVLRNQKVNYILFSIYKIQVFEKKEDNNFRVERLNATYLGVALNFFKIRDESDVDYDYWLNLK